MRERERDLLRGTGREHGEEHLSDNLLLLQPRPSLHHSPRHIHKRLVIIVEQPLLLRRRVSAAAAEFLHLPREESHECLLEEAVAVLGLHPHGRRLPRRLRYPAPHQMPVAVPRAH